MANLRVLEAAAVDAGGEHVTLCAVPLRATDGKVRRSLVFAPGLVRARVTVKVLREDGCTTRGRGWLMQHQKRGGRQQRAEFEIWVRMRAVCAGGAPVEAAYGERCLMALVKHCEEVEHAPGRDSFPLLQALAGSGRTSQQKFEIQHAEDMPRHPELGDK